jgi:hypothetical protein
LSLPDGKDGEVKKKKFPTYPHSLVFTLPSEKYPDFLRLKLINSPSACGQGIKNYNKPYSYRCRWFLRQLDTASVAGQLPGFNGKKPG